MAHAAPVVSAWEVEQLPDDWLDAMIAISADFPQIQKNWSKVEAELARWRAAHKTYRKTGVRH